jgi:hypothetical protein
MIQNALFFFLPFNISFCLYEELRFFSFFPNDFASFFVYGYEILLLFTLLQKLFSKNIRIQPLSLAGTAFFFGLFLHSLSSPFSLLLYTRIFLYSFFWFCLPHSKYALETSLKFLGYGMIFSITLAWYQYFFQESLGIKGESVLSPEILGVAKIDLDSQKILRGYGTFVHPNILAYMSFLTAYLTPALPKLFAFSGILVSFSRSVLFIFISTEFFQKTLKKSFLFFLLFALLFLPTLSFFFDIAPSFFARIQDGEIAKNAILHTPFGYGLGQTLFYANSFQNTEIFPWEYQPIHNTPLLILSEIGVPLFLLLCFLGRKLFTSPLFLSIFVLSFFDHYMWTSPPALFLTLGTIAMFYKQKKVVL